LLIGGLDPQNKPRLFYLESSGRAFECGAHAIGVGREESIEILKKRYKSDLSLEEATVLAVEAALRKTAETENVLVAAIDRKTKKFKELTSEEKKRIVEKIFIER